MSTWSEQALDNPPGRLREARKAKGWSQEAASERAGLHLQSLSRYERGEIEPGVSAVLRLAEAYGRPMGWFFGDEGLTAEEWTIIEAYRLAPESLRLYALEGSRQALQALRGSAPAP